MGAARLLEMSHSLLLCWLLRGYLPVLEEPKQRKQQASALLLFVLLFLRSWFFSCARAI